MISIVTEQYISEQVLADGREVAFIKARAKQNDR